MIRRWLIRRLGGIVVGPRDAAVVLRYRDGGGHGLEATMPARDLDLSTDADTPHFWVLSLCFLFGDHPKAANRRTNLRSWTVRELVRAGETRRR